MYDVRTYVRTYALLIYLFMNANLFSTSNQTARRIKRNIFLGRKENRIKIKTNINGHRISTK